MTKSNQSEQDDQTENNEQKSPGQHIKRWSKELLSILLIVGVISAAMDFYRSQSMPQGNAIPMVGTSIQGEEIDLIELSKQGEPVIVYFWATWCGACKFVSPECRLVSQISQCRLCLSLFWPR